MPRIGAGLGGLEWSEVKSSLVHIASKSPVHLLVCEEYIAGKAINQTKPVSTSTDDHRPSFLLTGNDMPFNN